MSYCDEAKQLVLGDRNSTYGDPREDYTKTAKIWSGILAKKLNADITPEEAVLMMVGLKISRLVNSPTHKDSLVDLHGYGLCLEWITTGKKPE